MKQVIERHPTLGQKSTSNPPKNHIPLYAQQFYKEWLYIRGINKSIESFIQKNDYPQGEKFSSSKADKIKKHIDIYFLKLKKKEDYKKILVIYVYQRKML